MTALNAKCRKVLLTGATGYVGRSLHKALKDAGQQVIAMSSSPGERREGWMTCNLHDYHAVREKLAEHRPDACVHAAWFVEHGAFWTSPENIRWVESTLHLAEAFAACGGERFVGLGTCAEYQWGSTGLLDEFESATLPDTVYGDCKLKAFEGLRQRAQNGSFSFAWTRIFHSFGPGEPAQRFLPSIFHTMRHGIPLDCSDGLQVRDFLHVEDLAGAIVAVLLSDLAGAINLGRGEGASLKQAGELFSSYLPKAVDIRFGARQRPAGDPDILCPSVDRLFSTGWRPRLTLEQSLQKYVAQLSAESINP